LTYYEGFALEVREQAAIFFYRSVLFPTLYFATFFFTFYLLFLTYGSALLAPRAITSFDTDPFPTFVLTVRR